MSSLSKINKLKDGTLCKAKLNGNNILLCKGRPGGVGRRICLMFSKNKIKYVEYNIINANINQLRSFVGSKDLIINDDYKYYNAIYLSSDIMINIAENIKLKPINIGLLKVI